MTLIEIRDSLISAGLDIVDNDTHLASTSGKLHVYLKPGFINGEDAITVKRFATISLFGRNLSEYENDFLASDVKAIHKDGKRIIFNVNRFGTYDYKENKKDGDDIMIVNNKKKVNEAELSVNQIFEINTNNNIRFITLTDFTASKKVSYAEYYKDSKEWDGDKRSVSDIMSILMSNKMNIDELGDGFVEVYSNGKWKEFK